MFNQIPESSHYTPEQNELALSRALSLGSVEVSDEMVTSAVDSIISRMGPSYLELMQAAKETPEIISDYKLSLFGNNENMNLTPKIRAIVMEALKMIPDCNVITKTFSSERRISVFLDQNREFDENQTLDKARVNMKLRIDAKDVKNEDPLDLLLSQLSKKILSLGYGAEGTFDIRLEKGYLPLEGNPWKWHFDGKTFKTSITVCFSSKENWSTRVSNLVIESRGIPAQQGYLYDALNVFHRAPLPPDLGGEELSAGDYRLFIRYNEFYTEKNALVTEIEMPPPLIHQTKPVKIDVLGLSERKDQPATTYTSLLFDGLRESLSLVPLEPMRINLPEYSALEMPVIREVFNLSVVSELKPAPLPEEKKRCAVM